MVSKKASMGIQSLLLLLAMLLIAVIFAGLMLKTADKYVNQGYTSRDDTVKEASTGIRVLQIAGRDGRTGNLSIFTNTIKLSPGSAPLILDQMGITMYDGGYVNLKYRPNGNISHNNGGYNTWNVQEFGKMNTTCYTYRWLVQDGAPITNAEGVWVDLNFDLDGDGINESWRATGEDDYGVKVGDGTFGYDETYLLFNMTSAGRKAVRLVSDSGNILNGATSVLWVNVSRANFIDYDAFIILWGNLTNAVGQETNFTVCRQNLIAEDLDDDGISDEMSITDEALLLHISSLGEDNYLKYPYGAKAYTPGATLSVDDEIIVNGEKRGTIELQATVEESRVIPDGLFRITPQLAGRGYYAVEFLTKRESNVVNNTLQPGDTIKLYFEAARPVHPDEIIKFNWVYPRGVNVPMSVYTGSTYGKQDEIILYPKI